MKPDRKSLRVTRLLQKELSTSHSVLDLGCGPSSLLQFVEGPEKKVGVEYWKPSIEGSRQKRIHTEYVNADIMSVDYPDSSFDSVILIDVIEHFGQDDAIGLLGKTRHWAKKNVIVVTPNGFVPQEEDIGNGNKKQQHLSGWTVRDLEQLGFRVRGLGGLKCLRGERAQIIPTRTPLMHYIVACISKISEPVTEILPEYSYHLFGVWERKN